MWHSLIPAREQDSPTLWPIRAGEWTPLEFAIKVCEEENQTLKVLVVALSELILSTVIGRK